MNHHFSGVAAALLGLGLVTGCGQPSSTTNTAPTDASQPQSETTATSPTEATAGPVVYAEDGIAIKGFDPVAYFTNEAPIEGTSEFEYEWMGATWRFASAENRDLFASNPEQYAPHYGGYCAWAVAQGNLAPIDPTAWSIVDDKLYLNFSQDIQARWEKDIPGNIAKANENWPTILNQ